VFLKLVLLVTVIAMLFIVTLIGSFYGFQTFYDLRSQTISLAAESVCNEMYDTMSKKNVRYEQMTNAIGDVQRWNALNFDQRDENIIQQCLQEELPVLSSYTIIKKTGFLNGVNSHHAKGTAKIIIIEQDQYLRLEKFEISYTPVINSDFKIPELHIYLTNGHSSLSDYVDLGKLQTNLGGKNYQLPTNYTKDYDTIVLYDVVHKEEFAIMKMENLFFIKESFYNVFDQLKNIDSSTKIESRIIYERYGFFEGVDGYNAKGYAHTFYEEDKGVLEIENFEISHGRDPEIYITTNSHVIKNGYWTFGPDDNLYIPSGTTNEIFTYDPRSKELVGTFVTSGSGGLNGPKDLMFSSDNKYLFVTSFFSNEILRYDGFTGKFIDTFVTSGSGDLDLPTGLTFGPDGSLYVTNSNTNEVLRYDPRNELKFENEKFVTDKSNKLNRPTHIEIKKDQICISNFNAGINCYDENTGNVVNTHTLSFLNAIAFTDNSVIGPDGKFYTTNNLANEIVRLDGTDSEVVMTIGSTFLQSPSYLTFKDNYMYVSSDNKILKFDGITGEF